MSRILGENGRSATVKRSEVGNVRECNEWGNPEECAEEESQQENEEKAGCGDLVPEMDRARPVRLRLRLVPGLRRISSLARAGEEQPKQPTERAGIPMVVGIRDQQQEADGQDHKGRSQTTTPTPSLDSLAALHQTPLSRERQQNGSPLQTGDSLVVPPDSPQRSRRSVTSSSSQRRRAPHGLRSALSIPYIGRA